MQLSAVLDVALGLAFTFFLLSLIASGVQEVIAGVFAWRGTYLAKAIDVLINNDPNATFSWRGLRDRLRAHFTRRPGASAAQQWAAKDPLLQRVTQQINNHPLLRNFPDALPSYVPARHFSLALLEVLRDGSSLPLFAQVNSTIAKLPDGDLKTTLAAFARDAAGDIDKFRADVEHWFDAAMDRASGIYKRLSQYVLLILGAALAVVNHAVAANPQMLMKQAMHAVENLPLPLGWNHVAWCQFSRGPLTVARALAGWAVTTLTVSLGAPFWFDMLQNISNLRAAGPRPEAASAQAQRGKSP
jgi:hypothetical protein